MKNIDQFAGKMVAGIVALGMMALASLAQAESVPQVATVVKVEGMAKYSYDGKTWQPLHKGDVLKSGAVIQTADKSLVDILMGDKDDAALSKVSTGGGGGSGASSGGGGGAGAKADDVKANIVRIFEQTMLGIDKLTLDRSGTEEVADTQLDLKAGQIMGNVKKLSSASHYEIKLPNGVAGIRGTGYLVSSSGTVYVLDGSVVVVIFAADGTMIQKVVNAGQWFQPGMTEPAPIPQDVYTQLCKIRDEIGPVLHVPTSITTADHTIIYISPIDGTSAH